MRDTIGTEDAYFRYQMFKNTRGMTNILPGRRGNLFPTQDLRYVYPKEHNEAHTDLHQVLLPTACCNQPSTSFLTGRKIANDPTETALRFQADFLLPNKGRRRTTTIYGLDDSENGRKA